MPKTAIFFLLVTLAFAMQSEKRTIRSAGALIRLLQKEMCVGIVSRVSTITGSHVSKSHSKHCKTKAAHKGGFDFVV